MRAANSVFFSNGPGPRFRKATTASCCCARSATKSVRPSPSRSAVGTWIAPGRSSRVVGTNRGSFQSVVRFSRRRIPPRVYRPNAATTRSRSPSPSKSAASTSVTRGSFSARTRFSKVPSPRRRSHTTLPFSWSSGRKKPMSAISRSVRPSRSRSAAAAWAGFGTLAISRSSPGRLAGSPVRTIPWPMSQATISSLPSPSRSRNRVFARIGTGAAPGGLSSRRSNRPESGVGQGSGVGSVSGARPSK